MRFIVYSTLIFSLNLFAETMERFSSNDCLKSVFETSIEHKTYLFGLLTAKLKIEKKECILKISFKEVLEKKWEVDLCREPIHIKHQNSGSLTVYKKEKSCDGSNDDFCKSYQELQEVLQDHGLIFAKGDREKLNDDHGRVYCSYLLLNKYLGYDTVFSLYSKPDDIYTHKKESCELPPREENDELLKVDKDENQQVSEKVLSNPTKPVIEENTTEVTSEEASEKSSEPEKKKSF